MKNRNTRRGFTLIELVIAVLIIGILAAVAVPMYKHAMIKSRFSTVMPVAKTIADAQESYYLRNGQYASEQAALDVTPPNVENTTIELSGTDEDADENYAYVVASRSDVPGAKYIQYQKNSPRFAENIHCEALDADAEATWLCEKGLKGTPVAGGISGEGYTTYILQGNSSDGWFVKECTGDGHQERTCSSGCGKITVEGSCDTSTGEWTYEEDTDESSCPQKPATQTQSCGSDYAAGNKTKEAVCNSAGTGWEYETEWNVSGCIPKGTVYNGDNKVDVTDYGECNASGSNSNTYRCSQGTFSNHSVCNSTGTKGMECVYASFDHYSVCNSSTTSGMMTCSRVTMRDHSVCNGNGATSCYGNALYKIFDDYSKCYGNASYSCGDLSFTNNSRCYKNHKEACPYTDYDATSCCVAGSGFTCDAGTSCAEKGLPADPWE